MIFWKWCNSWLWSSGDTSQTIVINNSGKYWVIATPQKGCEASDTLSIKGKLCYVKELIFQNYLQEFIF